MYLLCGLKKIFAQENGPKLNWQLTFLAAYENEPKQTGVFDEVASYLKMKVAMADGESLVLT